MKWRDLFTALLQALLSWGLERIRERRPSPPPPPPDSAG